MRTFNGLQIFTEQVNNIQEIAAEHQVTNYIASLLYHSKT
jgi:hypothetical protein